MFFSSYSSFSFPFPFFPQNLWVLVTFPLHFPPPSFHLLLRFAEGTILGLGSVGLLTSFSGSLVAQLLTVYLVPLEALYCLVKVVYFEATGAPELQMPTAVLGASLLALSVFRASVFLDRKYRAM